MQTTAASDNTPGEAIRQSTIVLKTFLTILPSKAGDAAFLEKMLPSANSAVTSLDNLAAELLNSHPQSG